MPLFLTRGLSLSRCLSHSLSLSSTRYLSHSVSLSSLVTRYPCHSLSPPLPYTLLVSHSFSTSLVACPAQSDSHALSLSHRLTHYLTRTHSLIVLSLIHWLSLGLPAHSSLTIVGLRLLSHVVCFSHSLSVSHSLSLSHSRFLSDSPSDTRYPSHSFPPPPFHTFHCF